MDISIDFSLVCLKHICMHIKELFNHYFALHTSLQLQVVGCVYFIECEFFSVNVMHYVLTLLR